MFAVAVRFDAFSHLPSSLSLSFSLFFFAFCFGAPTFKWAPYWSGVCAAVRCSTTQHRRAVIHSAQYCYYVCPKQGVPLAEVAHVCPLAHKSDNTDGTSLHCRTVIRRRWNGTFWLPVSTLSCSTLS